jgi:uncharacterized pyridoxal phosphate-containing UPF0001 family protein
VVEERIRRAGGDPGRIRVVAVTKGFDAAVVDAAVAAGLSDLGENYGSELLAKAPRAPGSVRWHHLGTVQRRQVRRLAPVVSWWHSVCRVEEGQAIGAVKPGAEVFVQLRFAGGPPRRGVPPDEAPDLVRRLAATGVVPIGLMTLGVAGDPDATRAAFRATADLARGLGLRECSMGMSGDLELAVAEGATVVRVGRTLFGSRPADAPPLDGPAAVT